MGDDKMLIVWLLLFLLVAVVLVEVYNTKIRWCGCGDEILIKGKICEVCKFMEDERENRGGAEL
jgi:hypothetical protein